MRPEEIEQLARPQRAPVPSDGQAVVVHAATYVRHIIDGQDGRDLARILRLRSELGRAEYGTELQAGNGRSAAIDALQEACDLLMYATQGELEATDGVERLQWTWVKSQVAPVARGLLSLCRTELRQARLAARDGR